MGGARVPLGERGLVVFASYYYVPYVSGLTLYMRQLAEGLVDRGFSVVVVTGRHDSRLPRRESMSGVEVRRLKPLARIDKGMFLPGLVPTTARLSAHARAVLPVLPLLEAGAIRLVAGRKTLPLYVCDLRLSGRPISRVIERAAALSARATLGSSARFGALTVDFAGASRVVGRYAPKAIEVRPPIDPGRFQPTPGEAGFRAHLGLEESTPLVGFVGRLVYEKGIPVLIRAMRRVRERLSDAHLVVVGEGDAVAGGGLGSTLRAELAREPWITFTGYLDDEDLPRLYRTIDVLALPSIDPLEAFGMVQVEAMLCGTPVVASDMPGVRVPVTRTGMGRLASAGNDRALAEALLAVLEGPESYRRSREEVLDALPPEEPIDVLAQAIQHSPLRHPG